MAYFNRMVKQLCFIILVLLSYSLQANSPYTITSIPSPYLKSQMIFVINPDNIITPKDEQQINNQLAQLEQQTSIETIVVAVNSIGNIDTRKFANKLFNHWKIGKAEKNNGLLILLVVDQREVVFETGYGLEGVLPDVTCYRIQQEYMVPLLRDNRFSEGLVSGVLTIYNYFTDEDLQQTLLDDNWQDEGRSFPWSAFGLLLIKIIAISLAIVIIVPRLIPYKNPEILLRRTKIMVMIVGFLIFIFVPAFIVFVLICSFYCRWLTHKAIPCPKCQQYGYNLLKKQDALVYLNEKEQYESVIKAVKYCVCQCKYCQHIFKLETPSKKYIRCLSCQYHAAKKINSETVRKATYSKTGILNNTYECLHCGKFIKKKVSLPKRVRSSSGSESDSSSSSGGGGSFGGGSSGGGGSRSSF